MLFLVTPKHILSIVYQIKNDPFNAMDPALHYALPSQSCDLLPLLLIYVQVSNVNLLSLSTPSNINDAQRYLSFDYHPFDLNI